jgi:hypothetical protein
MVNHLTTTVTGNAFQMVYPISTASIALQMRDSQQNLFNATFHTSDYTLPMFNITVIAGTNVLIPIQVGSSTPNTGYFTFTFIVPSYYSQLTIYVSVNELAAGFVNITGSPFSSTMT